MSNGHPNIMYQLIHSIGGCLQYYYAWFCLSKQANATLHPHAIQPSCMITYITPCTFYPIAFIFALLLLFSSSFFFISVPRMFLAAWHQTVIKLSAISSPFRLFSPKLVPRTFSATRHSIACNLKPFAIFLIYVSTQDDFSNSGPNCL